MGKIKRATTGKHEAVVSIPDVAGVVIVAVEPQIRVIPLHVEQLEVAIRVSNA
jgi:hypothetical protein